MTEQEAIERIYSKLMNGTPRDKDACDIAIDAFEKSYHYRAMERRLKAVYGDYDNLLETVVEGFCRHSGVDIGTPAKSRLLTDEDVDKWDAYRAIGTVEECREAREKQILKRPVWKEGRSVICKDYADRHGEVEENKWADWVCPNCGWFVGEQYISRRHNQNKSNYCSRCGQAIQWDENLEEMEDD